MKTIDKIITFLVECCEVPERVGTEYAKTMIANESVVNTGDLR